MQTVDDQGRGNASPVNDVLERMREALGVKNDVELADALGVSKSTISSWKKRGAVPLEKCLAVSQATMCSLEVILHGSGGVRTHDVSDDFVYPILFYIYEHCRENLLYGDKWGSCQWWGRVFPHLKQHYEYELFQIAETADISIEEASIRCRDAIDELQPAELVAFIEKKFVRPGERGS